MLFSRRDLTRIILPLIAQQVLSVTINMVDSMMVADAGEAAVSGISPVGSLDTLLILAFSSLATGGAVVVSQSIGKGDLDLSRSAAKQLLYAVTGIAFLVAAPVLIFRKPLLGACFGSVEADVMQNAQSYFFYIALSFPFLGFNDAAFALFRAMGNSMVSMTVSLIMNLINVGGNALLIYGFGMGAAGAAISTLFSRFVGSVILFVLVHNKKNMIYVERIFHYRPDFAIIKQILRIGIPGGVENSMFQFGKLLTQSMISSLGTAAIAANAVANTLANYQYMPGNAVGLATVTVVGRCIGAGETKQAKKYARILLAICYGLLWLIVVLTVLLAKPVIGLYQLSDEAADLALRLILYHAACAAVIWPIAFMLPRVFRASGDVKFPLYVSTVCMWVFRVALGYLLVSEQIGMFGLTVPGLGMGAMGVWVAMTVDWVFRAVLFGVRFVSGKWLTKHKPVAKKA